MYRFFRYCVFGSFIICNSIIAVVAIWNASLMQGKEDQSAFSPRRTAIYSTVVGSSGLVLVFPVLFADVAGKYIFLTRVWFELAWVGLYVILELAGAALATASGHDHLCQPTFPSVGDPALCTSNQVLQAFSWICSIVLLPYFLLLMVFAMLKVKEDPTIWHCNVRKFPWEGAVQQLKSPCAPPTTTVVRKLSTKLSSQLSISRWARATSPSDGAPFIVAPRPKRAENQQQMREAIFSYRSGLSQEYEIEHYQHTDKPIPRTEFRSSNDRAPQALNAPGHFREFSVQKPQTTYNERSFYPAYMQQALAKTDSQSSHPLPLHAHLGEVAPNPLGDWPQMNPPVRRARDKHRKSVRLAVPVDSDAIVGGELRKESTLPPPQKFHVRARSSGAAVHSRGTPSGSGSDSASPTQRVRLTSPTGPRRPSAQPQHPTVGSKAVAANSNPNPQDTLDSFQFPRR